ncbi:MAG: hypothetical protein HYY16_11300 [Planctomycetes bacterium]|nr:hypothetical protein [Planctomycetota bacterium]
MKTRIILGLTTLLGGALLAAGGQDAKPNADAYIGAEKCKMCHEAKAKGSQFTAWKATKHAQAFDVLGTEEAKKIAQQRGLADPQTSAECLKCHATAWNEPADRVAKGFNSKLGVQCESCHGPGQRHRQARMQAAEEDSKGLIEISDAEIVKRPAALTCLTCHNDQSPGFKPFCFKTRFAEIRHPDPRRPRAEQSACGCGAACACKQADCSGAKPQEPAVPEPPVKPAIPEPPAQQPVKPSTPPTPSEPVKPIPEEPAVPEPPEKPPQPSAPDPKPSGIPPCSCTCPCCRP